ncbi:MAG: type II toxin-antitoxin system HicA family toxin [Candidatus Kapaibacterium sp.]
MANFEQLLIRVLKGSSDADIGFHDLCGLLEHLGFEYRVRGSHHIFSKTGIREILNLQPIGSKAKAYQVKQVRNLTLKYSLGGSNGSL